MKSPTFLTPFSAKRKWTVAFFGLPESSALRQLGDVGGDARRGLRPPFAYVLPTRTMETAMTPRSGPSTAPSTNTAANINKKVSSVFNFG
jgi:hypothetical protein